MPRKITRTHEGRWRRNTLWVENWWRRRKEGWGRVEEGQWGEGVGVVGGGKLGRIWGARKLNWNLSITPEAGVYSHQNMPVKPPLLATSVWHFPFFSWLFPFCIPWLADCSPKYRAARRAVTREKGPGDCWLKTATRHHLVDVALLLV